MWTTHGVYLELFIACIIYQISVLDDGIKEQSSKGLVGLDAHAKLTTKKLKLETDCAFALQLHHVLPQSFCLLIGSESQACWIKSRLDDHAAWLMNQSTNKMLGLEVAFSRFVSSLPSELRGARCDESTDLAFVLKGISSLGNNLSNEFREMKDKLNEMTSLQRTQLSMLAYLQAYKFPHYSYSLSSWVIPADNKGHTTFDWRCSECSCKISGRADAQHIVPVLLLPSHGQAS